METTLERLSSPTIYSATDAELIAYLRRSCKIAELVTLAEHDILVSTLCQQLELTVADEELQSAGDRFRQEHHLLSVAETEAWLIQQRITLENWTQGLKQDLLAQKLKNHLFGVAVDGHYMSHRDRFKRVALSQILVLEQMDALNIVKALREDNASFCALALEYSKGKQSQASGGFVGVRFMTELLPEIVAAIADVPAGEIVEPVKTKVGYHILKVEKWFPTELSESVRELILESLFQSWLAELRQS